MEGSAKMRAELTHALSDIDDPDRPTKKIGWFDWMDMDIEEHAARKKREKEQSVLDSLPKRMRVPKKHAPTFASMLCTGIVLTLHMLLALLQVWSVRFNLWMNYVSVDVVGGSVDVPDEWMELDEETNPLLLRPPRHAGKGKDGAAATAADDGTKADGSFDSSSSGLSGRALLERVEYNNSTLSMPRYLPTHACVTPGKLSEAPVLLPLLYLPTLGVTLEYHRRRYYLDRDANEWIKVRCNTTMPCTFFRGWNGFSSAYQMEGAGIRFGENKFDVRQPTFMKLYKAQLLSPFTVFQLFCVVLWMLDDYWQYSAFTLFMILTFEATVVFSRIKCLSSLSGMGNKSRKMMVYREGSWNKVWSTDLLPGDILSLTRCVPPKKKMKKEGGGGGDDGVKDATTTKNTNADEDGDVVPADVLLLRGSTVVNEASLTGESVPQMKEGFTELLEGEMLDIKTRHKTHVLYAGTKILQCKGVEVTDKEEASSDEEEDKNVTSSSSSSSAPALLHPHAYGDIPNPPDGGCIAFVLRTGFSSAQGKLVRMIEGSQEKVKGHEKETGLLLLLLFVFAVASSSYVLYHGLRDENRSQYELLLHCILIVTSVIPPELPMQMALAVNNSLMTLMKLQIFCTEPYRVPMAGKLDACLFDKTGTLTTDELVPVGVMNSATVSTDHTSSSSSASKASPARKDGVKKDDAESRLLMPMSKLSHEAAALVLAGCHSLILIDGETTGDPLESAALKAMRWEVAAKSGNVVPSPATEKKLAGLPLSVAGSSSCSEIKILSRHHFSSKLQRMSCVVKDVANRRHYSVVKGSPEMIGTLLQTKPKGYDKAAQLLSRRGYRVISLAFKPLSNQADVDAAKDARSVCEDNLSFAGFVAFTCRVRRDTKMVLSKLKEGGMSVAMVTGDALLTAIHVAKEVNICDSEDAEDDGPLLFGTETNRELQELLESKRAQNPKSAPSQAEKLKKSELKSILILEQDDTAHMYWQRYDDDSAGPSYAASEVPEL
jgi:cation-transporting ATPase 13A1